MTFLASHSFHGVYPRDRSVAFAFAPWCDPRIELDDGIIMQYVCGDHVLDNIPLFALDCADFRLHMCASETKLNVSRFGHQSAWEWFVRACGVHWGRLVVGWCYWGQLA